MRKSGFALTAALLALSATSALAADADGPDLAPTIVPDEVGGWYGNVHVSADLQAETNNANVIVPALGAGGKIAYDGGEGSFGFQADIDGRYASAGLISPTAATGTSPSGSITSTDAALHLTYMMSSSIKLGAFVGNTTLGASGTYPSGISLPFDANPLTSGDLLIGMLGVGVEGLYAVDKDTTVQARVAYLDPSYVSFSGKDSLGTSSYNAFNLASGYGVAVSGEVSHRFTRNFSGRLDAGYIYAGNNSVGSASIIRTQATGQYSFDSMPVALGTYVGWDSASTNGSRNENVINTGIKATYSFGDNVHGAQGRLFHSGLPTDIN